MERKRSKWMQTRPIGGGQLDRRQFLRSVAGLGLSAASLGLLDGCAGRPVAPGVATETLETTTIRLIKSPSICVAPQYMAEDFLKGEGFTTVQYIDNPSNNVLEPISAGLVDMGLQFSGPNITYVDDGKSLTVLAGIHVGCFVLFGTEQVNSIADLKGKTVSITALGGPEHVFLSSMLAYVGLNPTSDVTWITRPRPEAQQLLADGKIDALLAFPPFAQELQAKKIGHVVVNSMVDKPWSQYFCCMVVGRQEFVQQNPVATKRALRAILKATDSVALQPDRAAKLLVDRGFTTNYDYALQAMQDIPYNHWRDFEPADTLRFFSLRLRDAGMIKSTPDEIIAKSADWRFLNELKQELPAPVSSVGSSGLVCRVG
jgi:NitT/TauT family transport system substrate-binding protein